MIGSDNIDRSFVSRKITLDVTHELDSSQVASGGFNYHNVGTGLPSFGIEI